MILKSPVGYVIAMVPDSGEPNHFKPEQDQGLLSPQCRGPEKQSLSRAEHLCHLGADHEPRFGYS